MKNWLFVLLSFVAAGGIFFAITKVLGPKPISKINPTEISSGDQAGALVYRRLRQEIRSNSLLVLGSSPWVLNYDEIWSGLLLTAYSDKYFPKHLFQEPNLKPLRAIKGLEVENLDAIEAIPVEAPPGEFNVVHTVFNESSNLFADTLALKLSGDEKKTRMVTITMLPFVVNDSQLENLVPSCPLESIAESETEQIGCIVKRVSRRFFRKSLDPNKMWVALEQHSSRDYYLFFYDPKTHAPSEKSPEEHSFESEAKTGD